MADLPPGLDLNTVEQLAKWLEDGAGEKESHWNRVYATKLRKEAHRLRIKEAYPTRVGEFSGSMDALQIIQKDRDYWKQRARQLELPHVGLPDEIDLKGMRDEKYDIEYMGKAVRNSAGKYNVMARVGLALCVVEVTLTPRPDAITQAYLKSLPGRFTVDINGKKHEIEKAVVTYEELRDLAGLTGNPTMVWHGKQSDGNKIAGSLIPGQELGLVEGMRVQVIHTSNA